MRQTLYVFQDLKIAPEFKPVPNRTRRRSHLCCAVGLLFQLEFKLRKSFIFNYVTGNT